jgi:hypothetical protein
MVKLWAMDKPYTGGSLGGYLLGSYKLNGLNPGSQYTAPQRIVTYTAPPEKKNYYICLALVEYSASTKGYVIADTRNMPNTALLGPQKKFEMVGPWTWQTSLEGGTIDMNVAKISHHRTGATGSLKLSVWASKEPYDGGTLHGYELGSVSKKALQPGYTYTNVKNVAKYTPPPDGTYFVYLVLFEFGSNEKYEIVSYLSNSKMSTFKKPKQ